MLDNGKPALPASTDNEPSTVEVAAKQLERLDATADAVGVPRTSPQYYSELERSAEALRRAITANRLKGMGGMGPSEMH